MNVTVSNGETKFFVIPSADQLVTLVDFYQQITDKDGVVSYKQKEVIDAKKLHPYIASMTALNGIVSYLRNEGYVEKLNGLGGRGRGTTLQVSNLLENWDKVPTKESRNKGTRAKEELPRSPQERVVVEVLPQNITVKKEQKPVERQNNPKVMNKNDEILVTLNNSILDMITYLREMPSEMSGHLYNISNQLELTDPEIVNKLQADKEALAQKLAAVKIELSAEKQEKEKAIADLQKQLESASNKPIDTTMTELHAIAVLDEVDRILSVPGWTLLSNGPSYREKIKVILDEMIADLKEQSNQGETN